MNNQVPKSPLFTIILAVKDVNQNQFNACVCSVAALRHAGYIKLIVVFAGKPPQLLDGVKSLFHSVMLIESEPLGVYSAYNRGLDEQLGEYVLFLGVDDLVLPGLDNVLTLILSSEGRSDIILCYSLMQDVGLSGPSKMRGALIFRNWCHQGLIYSSKLFHTKRFDIKYKVQADHKFNLELMADRNLKVCYRKDVITHFASGGLTSTVKDLQFRSDMPDIVRESYGIFYWLLALAKRKLADLIKGVPE